MNQVSYICRTWHILKVLAFFLRLPNCTISIWKKTKKSKVCILSRRAPWIASQILLTKAKYHLSCRQDLFANLAQCHQEVASDKLAVRSGTLVSVCQMHFSESKDMTQRRGSKCVPCMYHSGGKVGREKRELPAAAFN